MNIFKDLPKLSVMSGSSQQDDQLKALKSPIQEVKAPQKLFYNNGYFDLEELMKFKSSNLDEI